jgi:hypothetical protein
MPKTLTPAQIRKEFGKVAQLITDPRLVSALNSVAHDEKLFAKAKTNPKKLLAKHDIKSSTAVAIQLRLSRELTRAGTIVTLCVHGRYVKKEGGVIYDENGKPHRVPDIVIEYDACTTFLMPK